MSADHTIELMHPAQLVFFHRNRDAVCESLNPVLAADFSFGELSGPIKWSSFIYCLFLR